MTLPASSSANMTLGIVIYTLDNMVETATTDRILFERVSLCRNDFAIDGQILTFDETLRRCMFYYEKTYNNVDLPGTVTDENEIIIEIAAAISGASYASYPRFFELQYRQKKRAKTAATLYATSGTIDRFDAIVFQDNMNVAQTSSAWTGSYTISHFGDGGTSFQPINRSTAINSVGGAPSYPGAEAILALHYIVDSRLGI